jgi:DNA-3-methyladenine glycosylase
LVIKYQYSNTPVLHYSIFISEIIIFSLYNNYPPKMKAIRNVKPLPATFYGRDTVRVARELLGAILVRKTRGIMLAGRIVETEAYTGPGDPASHAARGPTPRSRIMFGPPGRAYVYFCYGNHYLLNVVAEPDGKAGAVLIRGLSPFRGVQRMLRNRNLGNEKGLLDGPGKLTRALEIDLALNGWDLSRGKRLYICRGSLLPGEKIARSHRIGIREGKDRLWRFWIQKRRPILPTEHF